MSARTGGSSPSTSDPPPSYRLVEALAAVKGTSPEELRPMWGDLDLESMDSMFANSTRNLSINVEIDGYQVEISSDGPVHVEPSLE